MFDAIVIGLGGMGSAAACHLASRGSRILGIEQYDPPHDRGSSHGSSRIIRQAYHENPAYVPLVLRAYELWEKLERDTGESLLQLTGGLMIGPPGSSVVQGTIASAEQHRLPYEVLSAPELHRRFPPLEPRANETSVYESKAGFVRPEAAVAAHLEEAIRHGAKLHFREQVLEWSASGDRSAVRVKTGHRTYEAEHLIICPGAWAPELLSELEVPFEIRCHAMCWFEPVAMRDAFLADRFPIYIWDVNGRDVFYGFPALDGPTGGVKAAMHSGGAQCAPGSLDHHPVTADEDELRSHLRQFIPALNGPLLRAKTCMYTLTPDEHFVVSLHPESPRVVVAAGFSGHGFKFTPVIGEILADLVTEGTTRHPIEFLSPSRFRVVRK